MLGGLCKQVISIEIRVIGSSTLLRKHVSQKGRMLFVMIKENRGCTVSLETTFDIFFLSFSLPLSISLPIGQAGLRVIFIPNITCNSLQFTMFPNMMFKSILLAMTTLLFLQCKGDGETCGDPPSCTCFPDNGWLDCSFRGLERMPTFGQRTTLGTRRIFMTKNNFTRDVFQDVSHGVWSSLTMVDLRKNKLCTTNVNGSEVLPGNILVYMDVCETGATTTTTMTQMEGKTTRMVPTKMVRSTPFMSHTFRTRRRLPIILAVTTPMRNTTDGNVTVSPEEEDEEDGDYVFIAGSLGVSIPLLSAVGFIIVFCIKWRRGRWAVKFDLRRNRRGETEEKTRVEEVGMSDLRQVTGECEEGAVGGDGMEQISLKAASSEEDMDIFAFRRANLRQRTPSTDRL